jgi:hypothetical protein
MADKNVESASAAPGEKRSASPPKAGPAAGPKAKASESGDPAVQKALADLYTAQQNRDAAKAAQDQAEADNEGHEEQVKAAQDALADLGYE